eukprot:COSAG02_NODE_3072_length_7424_cov_3.895427_4_plen_233_part_00
MHSDGAATAALQGGRHDGALDHRIDVACGGPHPGEALYALARELRDEGLDQRVLYDLFDSHRAQRADDDEEQAFDGLCDTMDFICGWHSEGHPKTLFSDALPQAQSRTREWQGLQAEVASESVPDALSPWLSYAMVAGFVAAVVCVHCTIAITLTATATNNYGPVAWVLLLWVGAVAVACSTARLFGSGTPLMAAERQKNEPAAVGVIAAAACKPSDAVRRRAPAGEVTELW